MNSEGQEPPSWPSSRADPPAPSARSGPQEAWCSQDSYLKNEKLFIQPGPQPQLQMTPPAISASFLGHLDTLWSHLL